MTDINLELLAKSVGKAISHKRTQAGFTQEHVAEHLNIGMEAVSRMERGIVVPTVVRLAELAQLFGCELADFLRGGDFGLASGLNQPRVTQRVEAVLADVFGFVGSY